MTQLVKNSDGEIEKNFNDDAVVYHPNKPYLEPHKMFNRARKYFEETPPEEVTLGGALKSMHMSYDLCKELVPQSPEIKEIMGWVKVNLLETYEKRGINENGGVGFIVFMLKNLGLKDRKEVVSEHRRAEIKEEDLDDLPTEKLHRIITSRLRDAGGDKK